MMKGFKKKLITISLLFLVLIIGTSVQGSGNPDLSIAAEHIYLSKTNPLPGEEVTIYALIYNSGSSANATVEFHEGDQRDFIGKDTIEVEEEGSALANVHWSPSDSKHKIFVSIVNVEPLDIEPNNNEASVDVEFIVGASVLKVEPGVATIEENIERVIPIEVVATQDLDDVNIALIYDGCLDVSVLPVPVQNIKAGETLKFYIKVKVPNLNGDEIFDNRTILVQAYNNDFRSNIAELKISIHPSVEDSSWWAPTVATAAGTLSVLAILGSTEVGKYKFLSFLLPLYTKLKKEEILDHYTRGKIHGYILANPGDHYNSIRKALKISNSTFAYHLHVLEREGVIKSARDGVYKRFYPYEMKIPDNGGKLKESQQLIIEKIKETPGISQKDIAAFLGVSSSTVNYHLQELLKSNIVEQKRTGMKVKYFLPEVHN